MKYFLIFLFALFVLSVKGHYLRPYNAMNCLVNMVPLPQGQTELLDLDETSNEDLKTCILKKLNFNQAVLSLSGNNTSSQFFFRKYATNANPNIIIIIKKITPFVLDLPSVQIILRSHRSLLFIAVTDDRTFPCQNGKMNENDFLTLESFMNNLWHRYKIAHVCVIFMSTCTEKVAVYSGKKLTNQIIYNRTIKLIDLSNTEEIDELIGARRAILTEDFPLEASIFYRFPTCITECENLHYYANINLTITNGYCGLDALILHDIVKHFKFKIIFSMDKTCSGYGYNTGKNITGSLGCIVRKEIDISFNSRFMTKYYKEQVTFLHFVTTDSLCVMVKQAEIIPIWYYIFTIFTVKLWFLIILLTIGVGFFMYVLGTIKSKITDYKRQTLHFYIQDAYTSTMFGFSAHKQGLCFLRGVCLCCSIMFVAIYQSHINYVFTTLLRHQNVRTLVDLYKSDYILYVTPTMRELLKQIHDPSNDDERVFLKRTQQLEKNHTLDTVLRKPRAALVGRGDVVLKILSHYSEGENKKPLIYLVEECFNTYYVSFISRSGFPFVEELQRFMERVREAGLPIAYRKWTCNMLRVPFLFPRLRNEPRPFEKIKLQDQRVAFGVLIFGHIASLLVFIAELWRGRSNYPRIKVTK